MGTVGVDMHELADIPRTAGGAIAGNVGAYGKEMSNCVKYATLLTPPSELINYKQKDFEFTYHSIIQKNRYILVSAIIGAPYYDNVDLVAKINMIKKI